MKNLTVNMPLAVPHQKPPSKYASHLYPFLFQNSYLPHAVVLSIDMKVTAFYLDLSYISRIKVIDAELKTVIRFLNYSTTTDSYGTSMSVIDAELKSTKRFFDINGVGSYRISSATVINSELKIVKRYIDTPINVGAYAPNVLVMTSELKG